jgi:uncharacterized membrane protein YcaP (DUF421 family)
MANMPWWEFVLRIVVLYFFVMIALRVMGKREIGQLSVFDFVVSVMIAEASTLPIEDKNIPIFRGLVSIAVLVALQISVALLQLKSHRFRHWVDGEPSVLVERGQIKEREMKKMRYTMHDLLTQLRQQGLFDVADVEFAILETSGDLSVYPKPHARPLTPADIGVRAVDNGLPIPLVVDGNVVTKSLSKLQVDENWVHQELARRGYPVVKDVFFAAVLADGTISVDPVDETIPSQTTRLDGKWHPRYDGRQKSAYLRQSFDVGGSDHAKSTEQKEIEEERAHQGEPNRRRRHRGAAARDDFHEDEHQ